jgi:hypothetical protein
MRARINKLENFLNEIIEHIELRLETEPKVFEDIEKTVNGNFKDLEVRKNGKPKIRKNNREQKMYKSFLENDLTELLSLLSSYQEKIDFYKRSKLVVGGSDKPNSIVIELIKEGILSTEIPITKTCKGKCVTGHLTKDGYLELEINNSKGKYSLRRGAILAFKTDPLNQWKFWEAIDENNEKRPLEEFRKRLYSNH